MSNPLMDTLDQAIEINEKLSNENDRLTMALQDIREHLGWNIRADTQDKKIFDIAREALEGEEEPGVKVNHEGHLYVFGEETIEVEYIGSKDDFPFKRVGDNDE